MNTRNRATTTLLAFFCAIAFAFTWVSKDSSIVTAGGFATKMKKQISCYGPSSAVICLSELKENSLPNGSPMVAIESKRQAVYSINPCRFARAENRFQPYHNACRPIWLVNLALLI